MEIKRHIKCTLLSQKAARKDKITNTKNIDKEKKTNSNMADLSSYLIQKPKPASLAGLPKRIKP